MGKTTKAAGLTLAIVLMWLVSAGCTGGTSKPAGSIEDGTAPPAAAQATPAPPGGEEIHRRLIEAINGGMSRGR